MNLPKISALDLRPLRVIVDEHNRKPGVLKRGVWDPHYFERTVRAR
jgi:hypothetical protein